MGWTAAEQFAVHPDHGTVWIEVGGVPMINAEAARGVDPSRVVFGRTPGYRNGLGKVWGVTVWEFAKGASQVR